MKFNKKFIIGMLAAVMAAPMLISCHEDKFKVSGEIEGGADKALVLEKSDFTGRWNVLDSVKINKSGKFKISFPSPASPEIYRLSLGNQYIYFPIDSTENINVNSSAENFGRDYTISGSNKAEKMAEFEKELLALGVIGDTMETEDFKRMVYSKYLRDEQGSIVSFYILTKTIGGNPLFNPSNPNDAKYFGAVATGFKALRPDDPHTALLEQTSLNAIRNRNKLNGTYREIEADEIVMLDIDLQDETGKNVKLSDIAGKGKPVAVIFSVLTHEDSPALNIQLAQIYEALKGKAEFYNVSFDPDQYTWRESAKNLPWVTVYAPTGISDELAVRYNVQELPSFFIYNANGELSGRALTPAELQKGLSN